ncbi:MAG: 3',5'-cyclic-AMP phosphodiesterase [Gammaproteobacteria bacterium]|nr:3',5'-cyclic-AMP phosphodiesterase [Gammaproteobacteria bacterium]
MSDTIDITQHRVLRVLQITDTHLFRDRNGRLLHMNTWESFERTLDLAITRHWPADLVLTTGDLVHDGSDEGYSRLHDRLSGLGVPVYCLAGNHDTENNLRRRLSSAKVQTVPCARHGNWAFAFLDSTVPGSTGGHLDWRELDHLTRCLEHNPDRHILVCLHHQPIPMGSTWLDTMAVDNAVAMFDIIDQYPQVRGIVWGHVHQAYDGRHKGLRMLSGPSTCIQFLPGSEKFALDTTPPGYRWLELYPNGHIETGVHRLREQTTEADVAASGY